MTTQNAQQQPSNYRTNKSFMARFATCSNSQNSLALSKNETSVEIKCINDLVKVKNEKAQTTNEQKMSANEASVMPDKTDENQVSHDPVFCQFDLI
jgi:hypothetical protein